MASQMSDDNRDNALFWLTICLILATINQLLTNYQIIQLERRTDALQDRIDSMQQKSP
jgi:hypothetical protein